MNDDQKHDFVQRFAKDFRKLVRRYFPVYPHDNPEKANLLARCQDETSIYKPYNWDDKHLKKKPLLKTPPRDPENRCPKNNRHKTERTMSGGLWCHHCNDYVRPCI